MKEKIINYIETLEAKAYQSDDYFKQRNDLYIENQNKGKEIERLNNIINELEKWLEEDLKEVYRDAGYRHKLILEVQDKLQELKGDGK